MARPRKTGLDYFPHDVDATTDPKLEPSIMRYGAEAYAFYFMHLEYCYRSEDLSIDISDTEMGQEMREVIQQKLHISTEKYDSILKSFLRHGAFDNEHYKVTGKLTSNGIKKRAATVLKKRALALEKYNADVSDAETTDEIEEKVIVSDAETPEDTTQSKVKKNISEQSTSEDKLNENISEQRTLPKSKSALTKIQKKRFARFYSAYPKKLKPGDAEKAWLKINPDEELTATIIAAVERAGKSDYRFQGDKKYIPYPATWLNGKEWENEYEERGEKGNEKNVSATPEFKPSTGFKST